MDYKIQINGVTLKTTDVRSTQKGGSFAVGSCPDCGKSFNAEIKGGRLQEALELAMAYLSAHYKNEHMKLEARTFRNSHGELMAIAKCPSCNERCEVKVESGESQESVDKARAQALAELTTHYRLTHGSKS